MIHIGYNKQYSLQNWPITLYNKGIIKHDIVNIFSAFIAIANELLDKCNLPGKVNRLEECSDNFFVGVYKGLLGDDLQGKVWHLKWSKLHVYMYNVKINHQVWFLGRWDCSFMLKGYLTVVLIRSQLENIFDWTGQ